MKYHIVVEKWAAKFIRKQQPAQQKRIMQALAQLPFAGDIKPMAGSEGFYRLRPVGPPAPCGSGSRSRCPEICGGCDRCGKSRRYLQVRKAKGLSPIGVAVLFVCSNCSNVQNVRSTFSCARYCKASSTESSSRSCFPARSATVRATRRIRSWARAERPSAS